MKKQFLDTDLGFALRIFGSVILANILIGILQFIFVMIYDLIGAFLAYFISIGMGTMVYITCIYSTAWQKGFRDLGLVSRDMTVYKSTRGLYCGLIASIPGVLLYIFLVVAGLFAPSVFDLAKGLFMFYHPYPFSLISDLIAAFDYAYLLCIVFVLPLPFITWLGYKLGHKNVLITKVMMYSRQKEEKLKK